jgi:glycosyltransferase involved in cell wall biosynthesis
VKVALVHDWLTGLRGGEKCLQALLSLYPEADLFTLVHIPGKTTPQIDAAVKGTSFLDRLPGVRNYYRALLPFYPMASAGLDLAGYDLVVSVSHAAAKNVRISPHTRHISYCLTPMRYIWDQAHSYFGAAVYGLWPVLAGLRVWDRRGSSRVNQFVAISRFVSARIRCFYGRESEVIYPPVDSSWIRRGGSEESLKAGEAFLYAGALVRYKRADLAVRAFNRLGLPLWVAGSGPEERRLRRMAGPSVKFLGQVSDAELAELYGRCRALIFPGLEDFGMVPVECMAAGRPVVGLYGGGLQETVSGFKPWDPVYNSQLDTRHLTGVFMERTRAEALDALIASMAFFLKHEGEFSPTACRRRAERFSLKTFFEGWSRLPGSGLISREVPAQVLQDRHVKAEATAV